MLRRQGSPILHAHGLGRGCEWSQGPLSGATGFVTTLLAHPTSRPVSLRRVPFFYRQALASVPEA